jgi:hypothetical protein
MRWYPYERLDLLAAAARAVTDCTTFVGTDLYLHQCRCAAHYFDRGHEARPVWSL